MPLPPLLFELQKKYLEKLPRSIEEIRTHLASNDFTFVMSAFHKLKGSGKTYGMKEISEVAAIMEEICQTPSSLKETKKSVLLSLELFTEIHQMYSTKLIKIKEKESIKNMEKQKKTDQFVLDHNKKFLYLKETFLQLCSEKSRSLP